MEKTKHRAFYEAYLKDLKACQKQLEKTIKEITGYDIEFKEPKNAK